MYTDEEIREIEAQEAATRMLRRDPRGEGTQAADSGPTCESTARRAVVRRHHALPPNQVRLGFLLERAFHAYRQLIWDALEELGLAAGQESLLADIQQAECAWSQERFARRLGVRKQTISRSVRRLEAAGMIQRQPASDRRQQRISLTPHGSLVLRIVGNALYAAERDVACGVEDEERAALMQALPVLERAAVRVLAERRRPAPPLHDELVVAEATRRS